MTLFIDVSHFEATIMVALTSMLVMYTLYRCISATLPQTAYLKMIDYWLLGGLLIPFIVFNILIAIDILIFQKDPEVVVSDTTTESGPKRGAVVGLKAKKALKICQIVIPCSTFILTFIYWALALYLGH